MGKLYCEVHLELNTILHSKQVSLGIRSRESCSLRDSRDSGRSHNLHTEKQEKNQQGNMASPKLRSSLVTEFKDTKVDRMP